MSFLGNLSFLGFKRDGDMNLYYIKWKILPKMYFLLCKKRKICSTEIFSTHQMGRYDPIWSNGCKRTAGVWPKCRKSVLHGKRTPAIGYVMLRRTLSVVKRSKKERSPRTVGNFGSTSGQLDLHRFVISWSS